MPTAWTLVLEMQFYLLLPLAALALVPLMRRRPAFAVALLVAIGLVSISLRIWAYVVPPYAAGVIVSSSLPALLWAFIPGMLAAQLLVSRPAVAARLATNWFALIAVGLIGLGWMSGGSYLEDALAEATLAVGVALLIPWLVRPRTHDARPVRTLAWFGLVVSYPFYLWHRTVMDEIGPWHLTGPAAWLVVLVITTLVGVASYSDHRASGDPPGLTAGGGSASGGRGPRVAERPATWQRASRDRPSGGLSPVHPPPPAGKRHHQDDRCMEG